jgi:hypothetical protein
MFLGFLDLETNLVVPLRTKNSSNVLANADSLPGYRVYQSLGASTLMSNGTGSFAFRDSGTVTGAANNGSGAVRITQASHGYQTGDRVTITGVVGTTEANSTWTITRIASGTYDLVGSTFSNAYVSGGTSNLTGLYYASIPIGAANSYERGKTYSVVASWAVTSALGAEFTFSVV